MGRSGLTIETSPSKLNISTRLQFNEAASAARQQQEEQENFRSSSSNQLEDDEDEEFDEPPCLCAQQIISTLFGVILGYLALLLTPQQVYFPLAVAQVCDSCC